MKETHELLFPSMWKLKVLIDGKVVKKIKSHDKNYIFKKMRDAKVEFSDVAKERVEFRTVVSNVKKTNKPRYKEFSNLPNWGNMIYGVNCEGAYYAVNEDDNQFIALKEVY